MRLKRYTLIAVATIVTCSLAVLLVIQFRILKRDIDNNRQMMELAIPGILSNLYDNMMFNRNLRRYTDPFQGTENFQFTRHSSPADSLEIVLKNELDRVLDLNYPELDYKVDGFISNEYGCMIHRNHRPELPKATDVMSAENHMCFCMILDNTLDISMSYENKEATVIGDSAELLRISLLLVLLILAAFAYTFYTIRKQKKLSALKRDFINNLTHEFKTPIFSISLAARSLAERDEVKNSDKMKSYVDLIDSEGKRLQNQVDKVLQTALLDSGNQSFEFKPVDIHALIDKVVKNLQVIVSEKKGSIKLQLNATDHLVWGDELHLKNVIYNLIDNALKYVEKAPIIHIRTDNRENKQISISIKDNGIGMEKETQQHVFEQFYRGKQGDIHNVRGFGLGLSYVRNSVTAHGGRIELKSREGEGSNFILIIPVHHD